MTCSFLSLFDLPSGSCAQWFSGTASALAVMVALGGYAYSEWRYRSQTRSKDAEELASIFALLRAVLEEAEAVAELVDEEKEIEWLGEKFNLMPPFLAIQPPHFDRLDKSQVRFLISNKLEDLCCRIDNVITMLNNINNGIEDYARRREEVLYSMERLDQVKSSDTTERRQREEEGLTKEQIKRLCLVSSFLYHRGEIVLGSVVEVCQEFNELDKSKFHEKSELLLDLHSAQARLNK